MLRTSRIKLTQKTIKQKQKCNFGIVLKTLKCKKLEKKNYSYPTKFEGELVLRFLVNNIPSHCTHYPVSSRNLPILEQFHATRESSETHITLATIWHTNSSSTAVLWAFVRICKGQVFSVLLRLFLLLDRRLRI